MSAWLTQSSLTQIAHTLRVVITQLFETMMQAKLLLVIWCDAPPRRNPTLCPVSIYTTSKLATGLLLGANLTPYFLEETIWRGLFSEKNTHIFKSMSIFIFSINISKA